MSNKYNHPELEDLGGQMHFFERDKLHEWVYQKKPSVVFEVGGGAGGGSTIQIAHALKTLKDDGVCVDTKFYTCDADPLEVGRSKPYFSTHPDYKDFVRVSCDYSTEFLTRLISSNIIPDFIFFDGPEHPELNLEDFKMLEEVVPVGTMFASHDWEVEERIEGGFSIKNVALRPYLENSESWKEIECLSGVMGEWPNEESENSVGLALYEKVK
tara:strand:- start:737 stop:1375 length:639 start_codon:yes stop_codon:yes gene_type:complete